MNTVTKKTPSIRLSTYTIKNGKSKQVYLHPQNADNIKQAGCVSVTVLDDKAYFELGKGNKLISGCVVVAKKDIIEDLKIFEEGKEYPLHYDDDMKMPYIDSKEFIKEKNGGNDMNLGKKNTTHMSNTLSKPTMPGRAPRIPEVSPTTVPSVKIDTSKKAEVKTEVEKKIVANEVEKKVETNPIEGNQVTTEPIENNAADNITTNTEYQTQVINIMSAWPADLMKSKNFEGAKKLIEITTEIANI